MTELLGLDAPLSVVDLDRVLAAVRTVRINRTGLNEFEIHDAIVGALLRHGLPHRREHSFGPRCRADIWVDGIVIEVKKQRPPRQALLDQVSRYAAQPTCRAVITVLERSIALPATLNEKPIAVETRRATGIAKAHAAATFVRGLLEADEPTLVFAHHHAVVDILVSQLADHNPVCITGRQSEGEKWDAKESFRTGKTNVCIISLRAATGIDGLQERARVVVAAELDWSPAVHSQAEDRAHRQGQRDSVLCYYLVSDHGTDPEMQEALGLKVSQFLGLMGDSPESKDDQALSVQASTRHMQKVLEKLRAK